ncbi:MAG: VacJ family lipoprotein [Gammaproteobacteria bacterium]|nr:ABC transporter [Gammaproteobacteria bacterium]
MSLTTHRADALRAAGLLFVMLLAAGCAATPGRTPLGEDPLERFNRGVYKFNDAVDRAALKPVAKGYKKVTPRVIRRGISNFFANLSYPITIVNQFLQGKPGTGLKDTGRFLLNSTLGIAGLFDVATPIGLEAHDEDFGQTLAVWGVGSGPYIHLPLVGPSTLRDAPGRVVDWFLDPLTHANIPWEAEWAQRALRVIDTRAELLTLDPTLERAFDPYAFIRDAWLQRREFEIFDGNPPPETLDEEFDEEFFEDEENGN